VSDVQARIKQLRLEGKTAAQIGVDVNLSPDQVKRQPGWAQAGVQVHVPSSPSYKLGGDARDREVVKLRDEVSRLKKELETAHRKALDDDAVRDIIGSLKAEPVDPPKWLVEVKQRQMKTAEVPITSWADWHGAEVVMLDQLNGVNEYNPKIMDARVRRLVERTISLAREHGPGVYPGIVVNLIGDFVSGMLHPELVKTDAEGVLPACMRVRDLLVWGLSAVADEFGQVYAPAVCGNHGRKTHRPEFKNYAYENFDWLIYQMVIAAFKDRKDDRVRIDCRPANEVSYRVFNLRFLTMHGDMMGVKGGDGIIGAIGPIMRGEVKVRGWADSAGIPYDHMEIGHWHQALFLPRLTVANTLKGYCEFAKNALRAPISDPSQPLKFVHPRYGITSRWDIKVNPHSTAEKAPWVSVFDPGKAA
jgi:hypothetical protein